MQPDIGRVGGLTEARRVCDLAAAAGRLVVPHAWKTGISVAAAAHLAMVTPHMPFFEFLPAELCESRLRKELTRDELVSDGTLRPPARPGLGIELDRDALEHFAEAARRVNPAGPSTGSGRAPRAESLERLAVELDAQPGRAGRASSPSTSVSSSVTSSRRSARLRDLPAARTRRTACAA